MLLINPISIYQHWLLKGIETARFVQQAGLFLHWLLRPSMIRGGIFRPSLRKYFYKDRSVLGYAANNLAIQAWKVGIHGDYFYFRS
jgi:hypothetical protein